MQSVKDKHLTFDIQPSDKWFVARCIELGVVSQGRTYDEALANLKEAAELYLEEFPGDEGFYVEDVDGFVPASSHTATSNHA